eukprot:CAMPEP_0182814776 /NCGR_PEP_ID=MMETSP0006_2-20121128/10037_1 /TAXON_ID=97485 /ORGANISM="Prymnesium parvum, Strain Texoma1" /LENGTH=537 /DNA_ID=CAMNT_0024940929 /DNA_START=82 /DNA_END=1696 /DNA_ORIENTATION=+
MLSHARALALGAGADAALSSLPLTASERVRLSVPISAAGLAPPLAPAVDSSGAPMTLLQVQIAFRHGARTPVDDHGSTEVAWRADETDKASDLLRMGKIHLVRPGSGDVISPHHLFRPARGVAKAGAPSLHGGAQPGMLTRVGLQQAVELGGELRRRYVDEEAHSSEQVRRNLLLPRLWSSARRLVHTRSTRVERTVFSAQGVLAGLYPEAAREGTLESDVMLNTAAGSNRSEFMVLNDAGCPRLQELFMQGLQLSAEHLLAAVAKWCGGGAMRRRGPARAATARGDRRGRRAHTLDGGVGGAAPPQLPGHVRLPHRAAGKPVPDGVQREAAALDRASARQMHAIFEGGAAFTPAPEKTRHEALRLAIGRMLAHIVDKLDRPDGVLHLYSGHDWTVTPLLMCVAKRDEPALQLWPPFCSNIAFELWSANQARGLPGEKLVLCWASHPHAAPPQAADASGINHHDCEGGSTSDDRHVRVLLNGSPIAMQCAAHGRDTCSLQDFKRMLESLYSSPNFQAECKASASKPAAPVAKPRFNK